jgi:hypothetical protein
VRAVNHLATWTSISTSPATCTVHLAGRLGCYLVPKSCVYAAIMPFEVHPAALGGIAHQVDRHRDHVNAVEDARRLPLWK